jgi:hypothetical protein
VKKLINDVIVRLGDARQIPGTPARKNDRLFEYADIDWGQVDFYGDYPPPVKFPAALVDIAASDYSNQGRLLQIDLVQVQVRIVDMVLSNSSYRVPGQQRDAALRPFDLVWATNRLLHGWTGGNHYGPLTKLSLQKVNRKDSLREYRLMYSVQLTDSSAAVKYPVTPAQPILKMALMK